MDAFIELTESQKRQYIDAEAVFRALEQALAEAQAVRGSMFWREQAGRRYLIRESAAGAQKSLGPDTPDNQQIHARFAERKAAAEGRVQSLKVALKEQQRLNRALRVGRVPKLVVDTLHALAEAGLQEHFLTVGTHALYAYETAAGVRVQSAATATRDIDLLFDTQKRLSFVTQLQRLDTSLMGVLRKADKTFAVRRDQLQTAVNGDGFEGDIIRLTVRGGHPHMDNFLDCVRSRQEPNLGAELGYKVMAAIRMGVDAYRQQTTIRWDVLRARAGVARARMEEGSWNV